MGCLPKQITNLPLYYLIEEWYGVSYRLGGSTKAGIDCSSFTKMLFLEIYKKQLEDKELELKSNSSNILQQLDENIIQLEEKETLLLQTKEQLNEKETLLSQNNEKLEKLKLELDQAKKQLEENTAKSNIDNQDFINKIKNYNLDIEKFNKEKADFDLYKRDLDKNLREELQIEYERKRL